MLFPAPSVRAEAELLKKAYTFKLPTLGFKVQVVVAVMPVLPGFAALPAVRLKLTALAESVSVTDWLSTAFSVIVLAAELITCAPDAAASAMTMMAQQPKNPTSFVRRRIAVSLARPVSFGREFSPAPSCQNHVRKITELLAPECSAFLYK